MKLWPSWMGPYSGKATNFKRLILENTKIHTLRLDHHRRWKKEMSIQMAHGLRTRSYEQFNTDRPDLSNVHNVQDVNIYCPPNSDAPIVRFQSNGIYSKSLQGEDLDQFILNDGFECMDQFIWYFQGSMKDSELPKSGVNMRLIQWTEFEYNVEY